MTLRNRIIVVLLFLCATAHSQTLSFRFRRAVIGPPSAGWYAVPLPRDIFKSLNHEVTDLRLYHVEGGDTAEIPYLLRILEDRINDRTIALPMFNQSVRQGKLYITFKLMAGEQVNRLDLEFKEENYNGRVWLEGSPDQKDWFAIQDQRILSIHNEGVSFTAASLSFPLSGYPFLRIRVQADKPLTFRRASFRKWETAKGKSTQIPTEWNVTHDKKAKQTTLHVTFTDFQPLNTIQVTTDHGHDFYRPIVIEVLRDSIKLPKGWHYEYGPVYQGFITSLNDCTFVFPIAFAQRVKMTIQNADNAPITIKSVFASGPKIELAAKLPSGNTSLFYGNDRVAGPSYDMVHFTEKIPPNLMSVSLGPEKSLILPVKAPSPMLQSKVWLWVDLVVIIAGLGFFTLRMMKSSSE